MSRTTANPTDSVRKNYNSPPTALTKATFDPASSDWSSWRSLASRVSDYRPDVVVLVARKMPRVTDALRLDFGAREFVISDLAIPFCREMLINRKVAVVDDVVNVGTTFDNVVGMLATCGVGSSKRFALRAKNGSVNSDEMSNLDLIDRRPIGGADYVRFVHAVPNLLQTQAKPYDLEFPQFRYLAKIALSSREALLNAAHDAFGDKFSIVDTDAPCADNVVRFSVAYETEHAGENRKVRFYIDMLTGVSCIVPMCIPERFESNINAFVPGASSSQLWACLKQKITSSVCSIGVFDEEAHVRAQIYCRSLDWGVTLLADFDALFVRQASSLISLTDAAYVFGPSAHETLSSIEEQLTFPDLDRPLNETSQLQPLAVEKHDIRDSQKNELTAAFVSSANPQLLENFRTACTRKLYEDAFCGLFVELAALIGADDPATYRLKGFESLERITKEPYRRLRVGISFAELVTLFADSNSLSTVFGIDPRRLVSRLIDKYVDSGALVPTFMHSGGVIRRVYRKG